MRIVWSADWALNMQANNLPSQLQWSFESTDSPVIEITVVQTSQWSHIERHHVSNHQQFECLFNRLVKLTTKKTPWAPHYWTCMWGIHRWHSFDVPCFVLVISLMTHLQGLPSPKASTTSFGVFVGVSLNNYSNKQSSLWWLQTPWRSCDVTVMTMITCSQWIVPSNFMMWCSPTMRYDILWVFFLYNK